MLASFIDNKPPSALIMTGFGIVVDSVVLPTPA
jgi:hypothetical protein